MRKYVIKTNKHQYLISWRAAAMIERNNIYKMDCRDGLREMARGGVRSS